MIPAVTSPAGVERIDAFSETLSPTRKSTLALISSGCAAAPPLGVVPQFADLMNEQQEIEQHHQRQPHNAGSRRWCFVQFADPLDDLQDEADAERHMVGPPQRLSQPVIEAMRSISPTIGPSRSRQTGQFS
jgi:hypothetical protein